MFLTDYYTPKYERCIRWDDRSIGIEWPTDLAPVVSLKDEEANNFMNAEVFE